MNDLSVVHLREAGRRIPGVSYLVYDAGQGCFKMLPNCPIDTTYQRLDLLP